MRSLLTDRIADRPTCEKVTISDGPSQEKCLKGTDTLLKEGGTKESEYGIKMAL
jgi:hypothetical protein